MKRLNFTVDKKTSIERSLHNFEENMISDMVNYEVNYVNDRDFSHKLIGFLLQICKFD
jgi:hypothetical protein